jgi:hypothetical protein
MSMILVGGCKKDHLYKLWDADAASEAEFEIIVGKALACIYRDYKCIKFNGSFLFEEQSSRPDLALVANDLSHWFIIEVELVSHSLKNHVLPQVRAFRYGDPQADCITTLARELMLDREQVKTLLHVVPRAVVVIANKRNRDWEMMLSSLQVQFLSVQKYISSLGTDAVEVDGHLEVLQEHLGFGFFSATDKTVRFPTTVQLPTGHVYIADAAGTDSLWVVTRDSNFAWVTKSVGTPDYPHECYLQLIRNVGGRITLKRSLVGKNC